MTSSHFLFCLMYLLCKTVAVVQQEKSTHKKSAFMAVNVGDDLTLQCQFNSHVSKYFWFKQNPGEIPKLVCTIYHGVDKGVFENEFKDPRLKMDTDRNKNNLTIFKVQLSDSATYYCGMSYSNVFEFVRSITVLVKPVHLIKTVVSQSSDLSTDPGQSVSLTCSVHTETCDGPHRVYWFKQSEESAAGVLYSHGGSSDQCGMNTASQTENSCIYSLPVHNMSLEKTGTYYCAVASCGQVLFGNGTRLIVKNGVDFLVLILGGVSVVSTSLAIAVTICLCKKTDRESQRRPSTVKTKVLQYMAREHTTECGRSQMEDTWSECIYFSVDQQN